MGYRGRGRGAYPGNGPFKDLPPWQRPGWTYTTGIAATADPYKCQRYPWLPRRWWADPTQAGAATPSEREMLENQMHYFEDQIAEVKKRLGELTILEKKE